MSERSAVGTYVAVAGLIGLWAGGIAFLAADARRRGVNVFDGLEAPRGYIRKPKAKPQVDEKAFWRAAREEAGNTAAREALVARARLPVGRDARADAEAGWKRLEAEFYASVRPKRPKKLSSEESRLKDLRRRIAEAEARGDLIEAKRLSSEARFIVTAQQNRRDAEEDAQRAGNRNPLGRRIG